MASPAEVSELSSRCLLYGPPKRGFFKGSFQASSRGSFKASFEGSFKASSKGPLQGIL